MWGWRLVSWNAQNQEKLTHLTSESYRQVVLSQVENNRNIILSFLFFFSFCSVCKQGYMSYKGKRFQKPNEPARHTEYFMLTRISSSASASQEMKSGILCFQHFTPSENQRRLIWPSPSDPSPRNNSFHCGCPGCCHPNLQLKHQ